MGAEESEILPVIALWVLTAQTLVYREAQER